MSKSTKPAGSSDRDEPGAPDPDHQPNAAHFAALEACLADASGPHGVTLADWIGVASADWHAVTLDAAHWFALGHVRPDQAALLLCGLDPHDDGSIADAQRISTSDTTPQDFKKVLAAFEDAQSAAPAARRTLREWIDIAKQKELRYHRWVDEYLAAVAVPAVPAAPAAALKPVPRQAAQEAAILAELRRLNIDPMALPTPPKGKTCPVKADTRAACLALGQTSRVFEKAWQRLRDSGDIRNA